MADDSNNIDVGLDPTSAVAGAKKIVTALSGAGDAAETLKLSLGNALRQNEALFAKLNIAIESGTVNLGDYVSRVRDLTKVLTATDRLLNVVNKPAQQADAQRERSAATIMLNGLREASRIKKQDRDAERAAGVLMESQLRSRIALQKQDRADAIFQRQLADRENAAFDKRQRQDPEYQVQQRLASGNLNQDPRLVQQRAGARLNSISALTSFQGGAPFLLHQAEIVAQFRAIDVALREFASAAAFPVKLQQSMAELQAVTASTAGSLKEFAPLLVDMGKQTRFSAEELTKAAIELGKTGFKLGEIHELIKPITDLATGSGLELKQATDLVANAITEFGLRASQGAQVADTFTNALRNSRLDATKLADTIEHVASIAVDAGLDMNELTLAVSLLSDAGLKSSQQAAGGMRQLIGAFTAPSEKLTTELARVGLGVDAVDLKANGLVGVLKNLSEAGFSSANAFEGLNNRTAIVLDALLRQLDTAGALAKGLDQSGTAAALAAIQMETLDSASKRLRGGIEALALQALTPFYSLIQSIVSGLADLFGAISDGGPIMTTIITGLGIAVSSLVSAFVIRGFGQLVAGFYAMATGAEVATVATAGLSAALSTMVRVNPILLGITAALFVVQAGMAVFSAATGKAADELDKLNKAAADAKSDFEEKQKAIEGVNSEIQRLIDRSGAFKADDFPGVIEELRHKFADLGLQIQDGTSDVKTLIDELNRIKGVQLGDQRLDLLRQGATTAAQGPVLQKQLAAATSIPGIGAAAQAAGLDAQLYGGSALGLRLPFGLQIGGGSPTRIAIPGGNKSGSPEAFVQSVLNELPKGPLDRARAAQIEQQRGTFLSSNPESRKVLEGLEAVLKNVQARQGAVDANRRAATNNDKALAQNDFQQGGAFQSLTDAATALKLKTIPKADLLKGTSAGDGLSVDDDATGTAKGIAERLDVIKAMKPAIAAQIEGFKKALASIPPEHQKDASVVAEKQAVAEAVSEYKAKLHKLEQEYAKDNIKVVQSQIKSLETQLTAKQRDIGRSTTSIPDATDLGAQAKDLLKQIEDKKRDLIKLQADASKTNNPSDKSALNAELDALVEESSAKDEEFAETLKKQLADKDVAIVRKALATSAARLKDIDRQIHDKNTPLSRIRVLGEQGLSLTKSIGAGEIHVATDQYGKDSPEVTSAVSKAKDALIEYQRTFDEVTDALLKPVDSFKQWLTDLKVRVKKIDDTFKTDTKDAGEETRNLNNQITAAKNAVERGKAPPQQVTRLQRQQFDVGTRKLQADAAADQSAIDSLTPDISATQAKLAESNAELTRLQDLAKTEGQSKETNEKEMNAVVAQVDSLKDQLSTLESQLGLHRASLSNTNDQLAGRADVTPLTFDQTLKQGLQDYGKKTGALDDKGNPASLVTQFGHALPSLLDGMSNAFDKFASTVGAANTRISDSFKQLGLDVLKVFADIALKKASEALIGQLFGAIGGDASSGAGGIGGFLSSLFGSSGAAGAASAGEEFGPALETLDFAAANSGGLIRKRMALGGAVNSRDAVPLLARNGEYVLRNSAVDLIGTDKLDALNTAGNNVVAKASANAPQPDNTPKQPFNIWVTTPDQVPPPGPRDFVAAVTQDFRTNGQLKQMVKQFMATG